MSKSLLISIISFFAACSSSLTLSRTILITFVWCSSSASAGMISRRTKDPLGPLILLTTSSIRQPTISSISPSIPWATPTIRSAAFRSLDRSAGPPAIRRRTLVYSSSVCRTAPIPSNDRLMLILKFSVRCGEKYWVWGSIESAREFI